jgi:hypothetical protein
MAFNKVSNEKLAELFSSGETTGEGSNMFIREDTIYSYGLHFKIAVRLTQMEKFATNIEHVFNSKGYNSSTSKQQSQVRNKLRSYIELPDCDYSEKTLRAYVDELKAEVKEIQGQQNKLKTKGKRFELLQYRIVDATERAKQVEKFTVALYGGNAIHFIKEVG